MFPGTHAQALLSTKETIEVRFEPVSSTTSKMLWLLLVLILDHQGEGWKIDRIYPAQARSSATCVYTWYNIPQYGEHACGTNSVGRPTRNT